MKTIEEYATDMVCQGAESRIEDDLNEDAALDDTDHEDSRDLALAMVRAIRVHADEVIAWTRAEQAGASS